METSCDQVAAPVSIRSGHKYRQIGIHGVDHPVVHVLLPAVQVPATAPTAHQL